MLERDAVDAFRISGKIHDCGDKLDYMKAQIEYALKHSELAEGLLGDIERLLSISD